MAVTDSAQNVIDRWEYAPFGTELRVTGSTDTPFKFNGSYGVMTESNGLLYMRARYYNPRILRFCNADPIKFEGGMNWYAAFGNNPLTSLDPSGTVVETVWDVANVGMGAYSLQDNVRQGNWGWAALDGIGLAYDGLAVAVPFLPAGASAGLKALRAGSTVVDSVKIGSDVAKIADKTHDLTRAMDAAQATSNQAARIGTDLHDSLDGFARDKLSSIFDSGFSGANRAAGSPDLLWPSSPGIWGDVTTAGQWGDHLRSYWALGDAVPILYQRGQGVTNLLRLSTGAGLGLTALELVVEGGGSTTSGNRRK